ncbi:Hypothetical predicted protein [Cloeon dipterum]|uniref:C2H2-type domain-containing protein n=1 Tax=Cloeon dipterum TaxID=197152 RepID=A0A8S1DG61_9INSE|nr:Hypothetical predicted protein [Cloeon dipterum]
MTYYYLILPESGTAIAYSHLEPSLFHSGSGGLTEMSFQKELCLICERPTADGAIFAVHVDKEKLQQWFLNVCGHELVEEIKDDDTICYFCAWQAEFLWKFDGMSDDDLVWWPRNLDFDDAARELRKYYFEGIVEQCWVQLEEVNLPEDEDDETEKEEAESESETHSNIFSEKKICLYCEKLYKFSSDLSKHVKKTHKEAIRCPGGLLEMSIQKALCLICERPTADGVIFAVHVDKEKLQQWFLIVCGHELADQVKDDDTICYFCAWQAEFLWKFDGMEDEDLVWWPRNLDFDDAARELRKYYFEGIVEQCCVQLEEVDLPESEEDETEKEEGESESETHSNIFSEKKKCLYCDNVQTVGPVFN